MGAISVYAKTGCARCCSHAPMSTANWASTCKYLNQLLRYCNHLPIYRNLPYLREILQFQRRAIQLGRDELVDGREINILTTDLHWEIDNLQGDTVSILTIVVDTVASIVSIAVLVVSVVVVEDVEQSMDMHELPLFFPILEAGCGISARISDDVMWSKQYATSIWLQRSKITTVF